MESLPDGNSNVPHPKSENLLALINLISHIN